MIVGAVEAHHSAAGLDEAQQHSAQGALAAARLADQAKRLTLFDGEGDVIDGADALSGAAPVGVTCVKNLRKMFCFHQPHVEQRTTPGRGLLSAGNPAGRTTIQYQAVQQPLA